MSWRHKEEMMRRDRKKDKKLVGRYTNLGRLGSLVTIETIHIETQKESQMDLNLHEDNALPDAPTLVPPNIISLFNEGLPSMVANLAKRQLEPNEKPSTSKRSKETAELSLAIPLNKTTDTMVLQRIAEAARQKARDASQPQIRPSGKLRPGRPPKVPDSALSKDELERRNRRRARNRQCAARERQRNAFYQDLLEEGKQNHIREVYCIEMDNAVIEKQLEVLLAFDQVRQGDASQIPGQSTSGCC